MRVWLRMWYSFINRTGKGYVWESPTYCKRLLSLSEKGIYIRKAPFPDYLLLLLGKWRQRGERKKLWNERGKKPKLIGEVALCEMVSTLFHDVSCWCCSFMAFPIKYDRLYSSSKLEYRGKYKWLESECSGQLLSLLVLVKPKYYIIVCFVDSICESKKKKNLHFFFDTEIFSVLILHVLLQRMDIKLYFHIAAFNCMVIV